MAKVREEMVKKANELSDHNVQIAPEARVVSQNLQGPYAIKKVSNREKNGFHWSPDVPDSDLWRSSHKKTLENWLGENLTYYFSNKSKDFNNQNLFDLMANENSEEPQKFLKQIVIDTKNPEDKANLAGLGEPLGQSGMRISIESNQRYKNRMSQQIDYLIDSLDKKAEVLCFQEQPYSSAADDTRLNIFKELMEKKSYVQKGFLKNGDVGIWVKETMATHYKEVKSRSLIGLISDDLLRGCATQNATTLFINIHMDQCEQERQINKLIELKKMATHYANKQRPKLEVVIMGDFNLFNLTAKNKSRLISAGYTLELVKGQERFSNNAHQLNYEAYVSPANEVYYHHYKERKHSFEAVNKLNEEEVLKGDALKTVILRDFKKLLANFKNLDELSAFKQNLHTSNDYKILKTGQDRTTRLFNLKTSSLKALETMIEETETKLQPSSRGNKK